MKFGEDSIRIEPLNGNHERELFRCGNESLDRYVREQASQDVRRQVTRLFVAVAMAQPTRIMGYYTLSAASIATADLPPDIAKRLPRYPTPAALLGRLAVDRDYAGRGLGGALIADAVKKVITASETVAMAVVVVDPIDAAARGFYSAFGFRDLGGTQRRMFLSLRVA